VLKLEDIESAKVSKMHTHNTKVLLHFFFHCLPLAPIHLFSAAQTHFVQLHVMHMFLCLP
jgi:hypothetical protein